ncbi:DUF2785 domain-containing protein [Rossellomorea aquimaris]|uniref:DUF2785 domain-containing protein n=1 Tax=Rossellomorea aquimaris TaxID=189382 RepID=UPI001CD5DDF0|nr:DUF2785 domain-containing protein [Rossellomorea aquimaris]MCA1055808.1 DUF2785 domain-containing protein [Rossellomorea aquimaris]
MNLQLNQETVNESELKLVLTDFVAGDKKWEELNTSTTLSSMVTHIGSVDPELRDKLIYTSFFRLIIEENKLGADLLIELLDRCQHDLLFKGIGENGTDTVFTRAFTTLVIALILYRDHHDSFLGEVRVAKVKDHLLRYLREERDLRGYVPGKGWAHSIAHVSDAVDELVKNPKVGQREYEEILLALWNKMLVSDSVYIQQEDERVITPIIEMLNSGLDVQKVESLIAGLPSVFGARKQRLDDENYRFLVCNGKIFLKSLYVRLSEISSYQTLLPKIETCLNEIR